MGITEKHDLKGVALRALMIIAIMVIAVSMTTTSAFAAVTPNNMDDVGAPRSSKSDDETKTEIVYKEERIEEIPYKTLYKYSDSVTPGETIVEVEGENGTQKIVGKVITDLEGAIISREEVSTMVIKEPVDEIILVAGLRFLPDIKYSFEDSIPEIETVYETSVYVSLPEEEKGAKDGKDIVEYALQFLGNPYVWGGTSLTYGCDCAGFVHAVFTDLGYDVPRNDYEYIYPVSVDEMLPGDVIAYPYHYAIYIGGGMEVGALNSYNGICITPVGYVDNYYVAVRIANNK